MNELRKMFLVLTGICLLSAFSLTALNRGLADQIGRQKRDNVQLPSAREILSDAPADFGRDYFEMEIDDTPQGFFPLVSDGRCRALVLETSGEGGYAGSVKVMTGIDLERGTVIGVRVTESGETPGIGSRAADPGYLKTYRDRSLDGTNFSLRAAGGDIEAVTGATRTSTAVADGVRRAVELVRAHREDIVKQAAR